MRGDDLLWLAGLLEGEGSFCKRSDRPNQPLISIEMKDEDVIARVAALWGMSYRECPARNSWAPTYRTILRGRRAARLMAELRPLMGSRRQAQIDVTLAAHNPNIRFKLTQGQADEIEARLARAEPARDLAVEYGVGRATIYTCGRGEYRVPDVAVAHAG